MPLDQSLLTSAQQVIDKHSIPGYSESLQASPYDWRTPTLQKMREGDVDGMKMTWIDKEFAKKHYGEDIAEKHGKDVRERLLSYISEGPVIAMVLEGVDAVNVVRKLVGPTYPNEAPAGTIRGDYAHISKVYANTKEIHVKNLIHASGTKEEAKIEVSLWFKNNELHSYKGVHDEHLF